MGDPVSVPVVTSTVMSSVKPKPSKISHCPKCGGILEIRKFVDACYGDGRPCDVNEDLYCQKCDIRWEATPGPHDFFKEA